MKIRLGINENKVLDSKEKVYSGRPHMVSGSTGYGMKEDGVLHVKLRTVAVRPDDADDIKFIDRRNRERKYNYAREDRNDNRKPKYQKYNNQQNIPKDISYKGMKNSEEKSKYPTSAPESVHVSLHPVDREENKSSIIEESKKIANDLDNKLKESNMEVVQIDQDSFVLKSTDNKAEQIEMNLEVPEQTEIPSAEKKDEESKQEETVDVQDAAAKLQAAFANREIPENDKKEEKKHVNTKPSANVALDLYY